MSDSKKVNQPIREEGKGHVARGRENSIVIPVIEEQLHIDKKVIENGKVIIKKQVNEEEIVLSLQNTQEEVNVERIPVNEYVTDELPQVRYEGETMIIPVLREVVVVEKRTVLVEELHVRKQKMHEDATQTVTLRRESVEVERLDQKQ